MRITQRKAQPYKSATNEKDAKNLSPFYMCVENQYSEKYNMLAYGTEFLPNKNNLFSLLDKKDFHAAHLLFSLSAKNKKNLQDAFWLEKYILERDVDAVRFLLRHGANTKNIVLTEKMCYGILESFAITKLLLDYGLAATAKSTKGYPLIFYAAEIKNKEVVKLLVKHGAISYFDFKLILYTNFYKVAKEIFPHCRQHVNFFVEHGGLKNFIKNILQKNRWKCRKPMILLLHKCGVNFNTAIKDLSKEYKNQKNDINSFSKFLRQERVL